MAKKRWWQRRGKLTTPDGLQAVTFPPGYVEALSLYGLRGSYGHIYSTQPNVRIVIDFLAKQVASLELKHYEKVPTSPTAPNGKLELEDSDLIRLLNRPGPKLSRFELWSETIGDYGIYGVGYWWKQRLDGQVRALRRISPALLVPHYKPGTSSIEYYTTNLNGRISPDELVVFKGYHPELMEGYVSPLETLRRVLAEEYASGVNREYTWKNSARKSGVVQRPVDAPVWADDQREAWRTETEGITAGAPNAGRILLLEDGMVWNNSAWSPEEMEYLGARELTRRECAAAFGVDPRMVFAVSEAITNETRHAFYTDQLNPLLIKFAETIDVQLLPEFEPFAAEDQFVRFSLERKLRGSFVEEAKVMSSLVGGPVLAVNEGRDRFDEPPVPGGDVVYQPLNSVAGGGPQASPQAPVETPGEQPAGITPGGGTAPAERMLDEWLKAESQARGAWLAAEKAHLRREALSGAVRRHLTRQERTVASVVGALAKRGSWTVGDLWQAIDVERWDRELAQDLETAGENGNSPELAKTLNALTRSHLEAAQGDIPAGFVAAWSALQAALNGGSQ
jgi:HK97 family phage portal protein